MLSRWILRRRRCTENTMFSRVSGRMWASSFFSKRKTAYEMRIIDWRSDVCSSELLPGTETFLPDEAPFFAICRYGADTPENREKARRGSGMIVTMARGRGEVFNAGTIDRSEEHTSELQSLMRISYAVFCLKKKKNNIMTADSLLCT